MRLKDIGIRLRDEKQVLRNGILLLSFGAFLVLLLMKFDQVWGAVTTVAATVAPVLYGIVVAYILNVFVHFFEDIAFRPFQKSKSKLWARVRRPLAVGLAYLVVALVVVFIAAFIIPGLIESMSVLAQTAQETVPVYYSNAMNWLNRFARENDLTFIQDFLAGFNWSTLLSSVTEIARDFLSSLVGVTIMWPPGVCRRDGLYLLGIYADGQGKAAAGGKVHPAGLSAQGSRQKDNPGGHPDQQGVFQFHRGQLTECVILGSLCYVGMSILQLDYALLISSVVALGALIPILGAYIGAAVGVIILLLVHPIDALIFLVFLLILQQVEGNMIYPRVVGSSIGLPPLWTLFAVVFWGGVLGIPGILFGTPATAVIYRLFRTSVRKRLRAKEIDPKNPQLPPEEERPPEREEPSSQEREP